MLSGVSRESKKRTILYQGIIKPMINRFPYELFQLRGESALVSKLKKNQIKS